MRAAQVRPGSAAHRCMLRRARGHRRPFSGQRCSFLQQARRATRLQGGGRTEARLILLILFRFPCIVASRHQWHAHCKPLRAASARRRASMSIYDQPFDPNRPLDRAGCVCGRHRSSAEHDDEASRTMLCEPAGGSQEKTYEGVVASAVMRKGFPKDAARRAFLKTVGAWTALAALSQFFPVKTATEVFAQAAAPEKKDLKVGFIPITCATPIIMAHPMGFYAKHGLNVEVIKTAG